MRVLIIEDDQYKLNQLYEFISKKYDGDKIDTAKSVSTSIKAVDNDRYDLILLDISLPTFDITISETGGKPQGYGGLDILRYLSSMESDATVIVVTQYEKFGEGNEEKDLTVLTTELLEEFPEILRGVIYYDTSGNKWQLRLSKMLELPIKTDKRNIVRC